MTNSTYAILLVVGSLVAGALGYFFGKDDGSIANGIILWSVTVFLMKEMSDRVN